MPLYVKDENVNTLAAKAQRALGVASKTEAVRIALERLLREEGKAVPLRERLKVFQQRTRELGEDDPDFDEKRFVDEMWGN